MKEENERQEAIKRNDVRKERERVQKEELEAADRARQRAKSEAKLQANLSPQERKEYGQQKVEESEHALISGLFGTDSVVATESLPPVAPSHENGYNDDDDDEAKLSFGDSEDCRLHAQRVGECMSRHGTFFLAMKFIEEMIDQTEAALSKMI